MCMRVEEFIFIYIYISHCFQMPDRVPLDRKVRWPEKVEAAVAALAYIANDDMVTTI